MRVKAVVRNHVGTCIADAVADKQEDGCAAGAGGSTNEKRCADNIYQVGKAAMCRDEPNNEFRYVWARQQISNTQP